MISESADAAAKKKILSSISSQPIPIKDVAQRVAMSSSTVSKYCHILEAEKKLEIRKFGNMKLVKRK